MEKLKIVDYGTDYGDMNIYFNIIDKYFYNGVGDELTPFEVFDSCIEAEKYESGYIQYENMKYLLDDFMRFKEC